MAKVESDKQKKQQELLGGHDLSQYSISGTEKDWEDALKSGSKGLISVKR